MKVILLNEFQWKDFPRAEIFPKKIHDITWQGMKNFSISQFCLVFLPKFHHLTVCQFVSLRPAVFVRCPPFTVECARCARVALRAVAIVRAQPITAIDQWSPSSTANHIWSLQSCLYWIAYVGRSPTTPFCKEKWWFTSKARVIWLTPGGNRLLCSVPNHGRPCKQLPTNVGRAFKATCNAGHWSRHQLFSVRHFPRITQPKRYVYVCCVVVVGVGWFCVSSVNVLSFGNSPFSYCLVQVPALWYNFIKSLTILKFHRYVTVVRHAELSNSSAVPFRICSIHIRFRKRV